MDSINFRTFKTEIRQPLVMTSSLPRWGVPKIICILSWSSRHTYFHFCFRDERLVFTYDRFITESINWHTSQTRASCHTAGPSTCTWVFRHAYINIRYENARRTTSGLKWIKSSELWPESTHQNSVGYEWYQRTSVSLGAMQSLVHGTMTRLASPAGPAPL